jgi:hypothetical protein
MTFVTRGLVNLGPEVAIGQFVELAWLFEMPGKSFVG